MKVKSKAKRLFAGKLVTQSLHNSPNTTHLPKLRRFGWTAVGLNNPTFILKLEEK
jgi:hypothetical protein